MGLREKIGQLFMLGFPGTAVSAEFAALLTDYRPGGLILFKRNLESPAQIAELTNDLQGRAGAASPLLIAIDQEGGRVSRLPAGFTIFPPCAQIAACESVDAAGLAYAAAAAIAAELRAVGINMNMAPVLDVHTNPVNPIIGDRAFSSDPAVVSTFGLATIKGLQEHRVVACGKHFPGHGDTSADSHKELPVVTLSPERLRDVELRPFRHAVKHGLATIMTAHVSYPALDPTVPATLSSPILTGLLRNELGFDGVIVTDDLEMNAIVDHYGVADAAVRAFQAGADVLLICHEAARQTAAMDAMVRAVTDGTIPEARLERSLRRIADVKARYLLPYHPASAAQANDVAGCAAHQSVLDTIRRSSQQSAALRPR